MAEKKIQVATIYTAGPDGKEYEVRAINGKKFSYEELTKAVQGYIESLIPAERFTTAYVNEEGVLKGLPANKFSWTAAKQSVYRLNGYGPGYLFQGNIIVLRNKVASEVDLAKLPTVADVVK